MQHEIHEIKYKLLTVMSNSQHIPVIRAGEHVAREGALAFLRAHLFDYHGSENNHRSRLCSAGKASIDCLARLVFRLPDDSRKST